MSVQIPGTRAHPSLPPRRPPLFLLVSLPPSHRSTPHHTYSSFFLMPAHAHGPLFHADQPCESVVLAAREMGRRSRSLTDLTRSDLTPSRSSNTIIAVPPSDLVDLSSTHTSSSLLSAAPDPNKVWEVTAQRGQSGEEVQLAYTGLKVVGSGSFGVVCSARATKGLSPNESVAIKKVLQDPRYKVSSLRLVVLLGSAPLPASSADPAAPSRSPLSLGPVRCVQNRELEIMRAMSHPNVIDLRAFFYSSGDKVR